MLYQIIGQHKNIITVEHSCPHIDDIYTADIPHTNETSLATLADDTDIIATNLDIDVAIKNHQDHLLKLRLWFKHFKLWRIKNNESKSTHISFSIRLRTARSNT